MKTNNPMSGRSLSGTIKPGTKFLVASELPIGSQWTRGSFGYTVLSIDTTTHLATVISTLGETRSIDVFKLQYDYCQRGFINMKPTSIIEAGITALMRTSHEYAISAGFCVENNDTRNAGEVIALIHSELSEALEYLRHGSGPSDHIPDFRGVEEELADCVIRVCDFSAARGYRLGEAIIAKLRYNETRPHKHGKQF